MDQLIKAFSPETKIRFALVDVTMAAKALEGRHLSGPTASKALAEGLVGVALLSMDAASDDEAVMLRINAAGPIGGLLVEGLGDGGLRGFTHAKIINDLDGDEPIDTDAAWGNSGSVQIMTSRPGKILNQASLNVGPLRIRFVLARYFNHSMQVPTACDILVYADTGGIIRARGVLAQRMEDSDQDAFIRVLEAFESGDVGGRIEESFGIEALGSVVGVPDIEERETRELVFKCRCDKARTLAVLRTLSMEELDEIIAYNESQTITCHMCGAGYEATPADLRAIRAELDG
jgi:molecular chaperone Hsp33